MAKKMRKSDSTIQKIRKIISIISLILTIFGLIQSFMDWQERNA